MDINEIIPYARNARHNKKAIPAVADSIRQFGLRGQIVLESRENPVIVTGHTRVEACKSLGWKEIPDENIAYCDGLTEDEIKACRIADNKTGESLMQRGYKYNYKAQDTRDEIIKLEDRRREVYANTAAGIRAQAAATQARRQTAFEGLVKERTRLQTEALQWQNSRAFNREQRERRRKADIELGGSNTKRGQEARRVADKLNASYRDMVDNHIKELTKVINAGVNSPLLDEYLPGH